jgi:hypothetical protein
MNFGECPYDDCDNFFFLSLPEKTPMFEKLTCDRCGRTVWYRLSRIDPEAFTESDFLKHFAVDEKSKTTIKKDSGE